MTFLCRDNQTLVRIRLLLLLILLLCLLSAHQTWAKEIIQDKLFSTPLPGTCIEEVRLQNQAPEEAGILVGTDNGVLRYTAQGQLLGKALQGRKVLYINHLGLGIVYAAFDQGGAISTDKGKTWREIPRLLPDEPTQDDTLLRALQGVQVDLLPEHREGIPRIRQEDDFVARCEPSVGSSLFFGKQGKIVFYRGGQNYVVQQSQAAGPPVDYVETLDKYCLALFANGSVSRIRVEYENPLSFLNEDLKDDDKLLQAILIIKTADMIHSKGYGDQAKHILVEALQVQRSIDPQNKQAIKWFITGIELLQSHDQLAEISREYKIALKEREKAKQKFQEAKRKNQEAKRKNQEAKRKNQEAKQEHQKVISFGKLLDHTGMLITALDDILSAPEEAGKGQYRQIFSMCNSYNKKHRDGLLLMKQVHNTDESIAKFKRIGFAIEQACSCLPLAFKKNFGEVLTK